MSANLRQVLPILTVISLTGFPVVAGELDFLDGRIFASREVCNAAAADSNALNALPDDVQLHVLAGTLITPAFIPLGFPGICQIDGVLNPGLAGRGSDLPTVMVTISCIDDVAVPQFDILVLENWPQDEDHDARVVVYPLMAQENEPGRLTGDYVECEGPADKALRQRLGLDGEAG
ncbi:MAG: hypothetical protein ACK5II_12570 [Paracoccus sp. (in: a-proteobacteria)]